MLKNCHSACNMLWNMKTKAIYSKQKNMLLYIGLAYAIVNTW